MIKKYVLITLLFIASSLNAMHEVPDPSDMPPFVATITVPFYLQVKFEADDANGPRLGQNVLQAMLTSVNRNAVLTAYTCTRESLVSPVVSPIMATRVLAGSRFIAGIDQPFPISIIFSCPDAEDAYNKAVNMISAAYINLRKSHDPLPYEFVFSSYPDTPIGTPITSIKTINK